ncbi:MAG: hypothetical protein HFJ27_00890 [Clostridia bacterium]|nr:hypothetical protein [Clostridia bacterium]
MLEVKELYIKENQYDTMKNILHLMVFIHLGISIMYRASYNKDINFKQERKQAKQYLKQHFEGYEHNPFLTFSYCRKRGIKRMGLWGVAQLYRFHLEGLFFLLYRFMIDVLKIDIKW